MFPRLWRATKSWSISIPISSRNFLTSTRSIPNGFWHFAYTRRGRAQPRSAQFPKFVSTKSGRARHSPRHFSRRVFHYSLLDLGFGGGSALALSGLAGNSNRESCARPYEGVTAWAAKS